MDYQDVFPAILAYEDDGLEPHEELELFSKLIETRVAFSLQGHYGRRAVWFMEQGYILPNGEITGAGFAVFGEKDLPPAFYFAGDGAKCQWFDHRRADDARAR